MRFSDNKFRNANLEAEINSIQAEFNKLLNEKIDRDHIRRSPRKFVTGDDDDFLKMLGEFYKGDMRKHESPTKRLIAHKNSAHEHKEIFSHHSNRHSGYKLHYTASPEKSYVIEPKGGELDYELAYRNPVKFYK